MDLLESTYGPMLWDSLMTTTTMVTITAHACAKYPGPASPSFVGDHYYCEAGNTGAYENTLYMNDPLWDGEGCGTGNNCCTQPGMPWFCRTLPQEVEGDIEVHLCANQWSEELYLERLEIYIQ